MPIYAQWDEENYDPLLPSLTYLLGASREDLPHIYFYHSYTGRSIMYPEKLDDAQKFSPELLMAWTFVADYEISLSIYQDELAWVPPQPEEGEEPIPELTQEQKDIINANIEQVEKNLEVARAEYEEIKKALAEKNAFHENLDENKGISAAHLNRIESYIK